jgi:3'-phosphoadenosine 5'-phosphosulfate sulfotransferase (PAPS reductase)/FAD synthetase
MDLTEFDLTVISSSAGKDSIVTEDLVCQRAAEQGVLDRVVVLHCDLGYVEWPGTARLARRQASLYGVRFETRTRAAGPLLEQVYERERWPAAWARYCTPAHKRGPFGVLVTALVGDLGLGRTARVLHCMGLRAEESQARRDTPVLARDTRMSSSRRSIDTWLPVHGWTKTQVWDRIRGLQIGGASLPYHPAYDAGMSRLSCSFCVLSSRADLECAARLRPELADEYWQLEAAMGHDFQYKRPIESIIRQAGAGGTVLYPEAELGAPQPLGSGRLTWSRLERQEQGDRTLFLYADGDAYVSLAQPHQGQRGRLVAVGLDTEPVLNPFGVPTRAHIQPGEQLILGRGRLQAVGTREIGLVPEGGPEQPWLLQPALYRCIDRPVELAFVPELAAA